MTKTRPHQIENPNREEERCSRRGLALYHLPPPLLSLSPESREEPCRGSSFIAPILASPINGNCFFLLFGGVDCLFGFFHDQPNGKRKRGGRFLGNRRTALVLSDPQYSLSLFSSPEEQEAKGIACKFIVAQAQQRCPLALVGSI